MGAPYYNVVVKFFNSMHSMGTFYSTSHMAEAVPTAGTMFLDGFKDSTCMVSLTFDSIF